MTTISGTTITHGITLSASGAYTSPLTITATGAVEAGSGNAIYGPATNPWTVVNQGRISAADGSGIYLKQGGAVGNSGTILSTNLNFFTVEFVGATGYVANTQSGYIGSGGIGFGAGGTVVNNGRIESTLGPGIAIVGGAGAVANSGTIAGNGGNGVSLAVGGIVLNAAGLIEGGNSGVFIQGSIGTVTNSGTITGTAASGINLVAGGTVIDAGTVSGAGTAILFGGNGPNRLVLDPGYHFDGVVVGGTSSGVTNTLELGSASSAGTLSGALSTEFVNLTRVVVDAGAQWTLSGDDSLGTGVALVDFGTLINASTISGSGELIVDQGSLFNFGSIEVTVTLASGGYLNNETSGTIAPGGIAVFGTLAGGTVVNSGAIAGTSGGGVVLSAGGTVVNIAGLIEGSAGVDIYGTAGVVINSGAIVATGSFDNGVILGAGGFVGNAGLIEGFGGVEIYGTVGTVANSGTIAGTAGFGINLVAGGTVIDSGTIRGGGGTAITFGGTGRNLLVLEHGYEISGVVVGSGSATNTVELAGSVGAAVTVGNGVTLTNFQDVLFGPGGDETLKVANISGTLPVTISGFTLTSDIIDLTAIGTDGTIASHSATEVTISGSSGSETLLLDTSDASIFKVASDNATGTDVTVACFCRGTLILTERGEVPVESLTIGDQAVTISGAVRPIRWIGRRSYAGRFACGQTHILPVCVKAGALADGVPRRDLWLSPNHALHLEGVLIEARDLVNGVSIVQAERVAEIQYFHLELDSHDVIVAEGAPAESFIDDDSRGLFHNAHEYRALYPDRAAGPARYCAPRRDQGHEVERARAAIARRAGIAATAEAPVLGSLRGQIEEAGRRLICGWVQDTANPESAVCLDILAGGELIGQLAANRYRADLAAAGVGNGRHGFAFVPPAGRAFTPRSIQIKRSLDGARLTCSKALKQNAARRPGSASAR
jgi:hypothetical protein